MPSFEEWRLAVQPKQSPQQSVPDPTVTDWSSLERTSPWGTPPHSGACRASVLVSFPDHCRGGWSGIRGTLPHSGACRASVLVSFPDHCMGRWSGVRGTLPYSGACRASVLVSFPDHCMGRWSGVRGTPPHSGACHASVLISDHRTGGWSEIITITIANLCDVVGNYCFSLLAAAGTADCGG